MSFWGLHILDLGVVALYFFVLFAIGKYLASKVHGQGDFYLAGRKLGKLFQFFLNFGNMTDANGATSTSSVVFKQGVGGVWIGLQTLFMTPYYWFMNAWFRRVRLVTVADLFEDRFGGKALPAMYAGFNIFFAIIVIGLGYLVSLKTMEALVVKAPEAYTIEEKQMVEDYAEYLDLKTLYQKGELQEENQARYLILNNLAKEGKIRAFVSWLDPMTFYLVYALIVGVYTILGGMAAAVLTDAIQGLLIIAFSVVMIPFGLYKLGGLDALHERVPANMFDLLGSGVGSEFTWYSILAILFVSIVQIHAVPGNMAISGSAKNEYAARFGAVSGGFTKRLMIMAWSFCGLIAIGLYGSTVTDADAVWGLLSRDLLGPGFLGLMLAGMLAANMSTLDAQSLNISALFTRNLYTPLFKDKADGHYVLVGRIIIMVALLVGIFIAQYISDIISFLKVMISVNVVFGAPILLIFKWRKLTRKATIISVVVAGMVVLFLPWTLPLVPAIKKSPTLTVQTQEFTETITVSATQADVDNGKASALGLPIEETRVIAPVPVFFEKVTLSNPDDVNSSLVGSGRFQLENYILSKLGLDQTKSTPAGLLTARFIFDGVFPFLLLIVFSWFTRDSDPKRTRRFYVKMRTPVGDGPEDDAARLARALEGDESICQQKILSKSVWEFYQPTKQDVVGFFACCVVAALILFLFQYLLGLGA